MIIINHNPYSYYSYYRYYKHYRHYSYYPPQTIRGEANASPLII